jgi:hyperosmotically inducible periplasmic protein
LASIEAEQGLIMKKMSRTMLSAALLALAFGSGCSQDTTNSSVAATSTNAVGASNSQTDADNTARNKQDRSNATLTPLNQGNSDADRMLTQQIRKAVVNGTNNFSTTAKNIKIITANGSVTLRGPVDSDAEKTGIDAIAKSIAGGTNVDDQLEVKSTQ